MKIGTALHINNIAQSYKLVWPLGIAEFMPRLAIKIRSGIHFSLLDK